MIDDRYCAPDDPQEAIDAGWRVLWRDTIAYLVGGAIVIVALTYLYPWVLIRMSRMLP